MEHRDGSPTGEVRSWLNGVVIDHIKQGEADPKIQRVAIFYETAVEGDS